MGPATLICAVLVAFALGYVLGFMRNRHEDAAEIRELTERLKHSNDRLEQRVIENTKNRTLKER